MVTVREEALITFDNVPGALLKKGINGDGELSRGGKAAFAVEGVKGPLGD